jgi:hypothetical protein
MRRFVLAWLALGLHCGGDSGQPDASSDATVDMYTVDAYEASVDVAVDVPPERAIWVATSTTLFKFDPVTRVMKRIADFDCSGEPMVDLAMNAQEELYGITSESVMRIDKNTGECFPIARGALDLPYATAFVPASALDAGAEQWLGYKYSTFSSIDPDSGALTFVGTLGPNGNNTQASGDIVTVGSRTFLTGFGLDPTSGDYILEIDPNTGNVTQFDNATGATALVGMAQWAGFLYIFSERGSVYRGQILGDAGGGVNLQSLALIFDYGDAGAGASDGGDAGADADAGSSTPQPLSWRGAASTTRAPAQ